MPSLAVERSEGVVSVHEFERPDGVLDHRDDSEDACDYTEDCAQTG